MKNIYVLIIFFYLSIRISLGQDLVRLPFEKVDNRIILKLNGLKGEILNFLFDTGTQGLVLDSALALKYGLENDKAPIVPIPFITGRILQCRYIINSKILEDSVLNGMYNHAISFNLQQIPTLPNIKIDGILGMNEILEKYRLTLDFEHHYLIINSSDANFLKNEIVDSLAMIYSDSNFETEWSKKAHSLPAVRIKIFISPKTSIVTNGLFDTGVRYEFFLLTTNLDSLLQLIKTQIVIDSSKTELSKIYKFKSDSVQLSNFLSIMSASIHSAEVYNSGVASFGNVNFCVLIGVAYLSKFKEVRFDYARKLIYLVSTR